MHGDPHCDDPRPKRPAELSAYACPLWDHPPVAAPDRGGERSSERSSERSRGAAWSVAAAQHHSGTPNAQAEPEKSTSPRRCHQGRISIGAIPPIMGMRSQKWPMTPSAAAPRADALEALRRGTRHHGPGPPAQGRSRRQLGPPADRGGHGCHDLKPLSANR